SRSLVSLADYCNRGCTAVLTSTAITITHDLSNTVMLHGIKPATAKLWPVPLSPPPSTQPVAQAHTAMHHELNVDFVAYTNASLGSPTNHSLLAALSGDSPYLAGLPRLTAKMVRANPPTSIATAQGHLDLIRQGQHSSKVTTKAQYRFQLAVDTAEPEPPSAAELASDMHAYAAIVDLSESVHSDLTGRFPVPSRRGNNYVYVSVYKGYIHSEPMPSRTAAAYVKATSRDVERLLHKAGVTIQYVPPHNHRANKAERAIRCWKNHYISMLCTTHPTFPLDLWDELLPQCEITLNLLRPYTVDPTISAYAGIHGKPYDFLQHPLAPVGTQVVIHDTPASRLSWAPHGVPGFYLGPALDHHRCYRVFTTQTQQTRVSDTIAWLPTAFKMP
ncbi:hypothetical protein B484DRAFT_301114, partial [Ochromonadaceae sp. CCMP2298]